MGQRFGYGHELEGFGVVTGRKTEKLLVSSLKTVI